MMAIAEIERRLTKLRVPAPIIDKHIARLKVLRMEPSSVRRKSRWYGRRLRVEFRAIYPGGRTVSEFVWLRRPR